MEKRIPGGKRKNVFRIGAAGILGAGLLTVWLVTAKEGPGEEDRQIYEQAIAMQELVDGLGFPNFRLEDYPVAMYDGTKDYVFYQGEMKERAPVLETFAGTAYPVGDHLEVIIPTMEQLDQLLSLAGGVEGMVSGSGYGLEEHKAALWHEAFHAYQLTDYAILGEKVTPEEMRQEIEETAEGHDENGNAERENEEKQRSKLEEKEKHAAKLTAGSEKENVTVQASVPEKENVTIQASVPEKENVTIQASVPEKEGQKDSADIEKLKEMVSEYREIRRQRLAEMPQESVEAEIRCELTEGTAYYVESKVYKLLSGEDAYEEHYLDGIGGFEGGRGKYYHTGMAKCLILDQLAPDWKVDFDFTQGMDEVLAEYL